MPFERVTSRITSGFVRTNSHARFGAPTWIDSHVPPLNRTWAVNDCGERVGAKDAGADLAATFAAWVKLGALPTTAILAQFVGTAGQTLAPPSTRRPARGWAFGVVYKARPAGVNRTVALKMLLARKNRSRVG